MRVGRLIACTRRMESTPADRFPKLRRGKPGGPPEADRIAGFATGAPGERLGNSANTSLLHRIPETVAGRPQDRSRP